MEARCVESSPTPVKSRSHTPTVCVKAKVTWRLNAATEVYGDMLEMGILIRPRSPVLRCRRSVAGLMLTTECMVTTCRRRSRAARIWAAWVASAAWCNQPAQAKA